MPLLDEPEFLESFRRGDAEALTRVYETYSPQVVRYLSRTFVARGPTGGMRVGPLDLEAAHQETFIRAFQLRARLAYDGQRPYAAYLQAVARSAAVDVLRGAGRLAREAVALDDAPETGLLAEESPSPEERALQAEVRELVRRFLSSLDEQGRRFAELRFVQGLSQERAGAALGLSRQEARTREARLRRAIQDFLAAEGWLASAPGLPPSPVLTAALLAVLFPAMTS